MTRNMTWSLLGGLLLIGLAGILISRRAGQPPISETAAAVVEPTAAPTETAAAHEEIATYRNEEFGFTVQYPKTVPCADERDGETCAVDNISPRNLSSVAVNDEVVLFLEVRELTFRLFIEKKLPEFTDLRAFILRENQDANEGEEYDDQIHIEDIQPLSWWDYPALAVSKKLRGERWC